MSSDLVLSRVAWASRRRVALDQQTWSFYAHIVIPSFGRVALAVAAAVACLVVATPAVADHYHSVYNRAHGLVHGSSNVDGSFFGRTDGYYTGDYNYCYVGDVDTGVNYGTVTYGASLCSVWTWAYYYSIDECRGATFNAVDNLSGTLPISGHYHFRHNASPATCRVYLS